MRRRGARFPPPGRIVLGRGPGPRSPRPCPPPPPPGSGQRARDRLVGAPPARAHPPQRVGRPGRPGAPGPVAFGFRAPIWLERSRWRTRQTNHLITRQCRGDARTFVADGPSESIRFPVDEIIPASCHLDAQAKRTCLKSVSTYFAHTVIDF